MKQFTSTNAIKYFFLVVMKVETLRHLAITGMIKGEVKTSIKKGGWMDQQNGFKQDE